MSKFIFNYRQVVGSVSISLFSLGIPRYCRIISITSDVHVAGNYVDLDLIKGDTGTPPRFPLNSTSLTVKQILYENFIISDEPYSYVITYAGVGAYDCYLCIEYEETEPDANQQPIIIEERTGTVQYKGGIIHS